MYSLVTAMTAGTPPPPRAATRNFSAASTLGSGRTTAAYFFGPHVKNRIMAFSNSMRRLWLNWAVSSCSSASLNRMASTRSIPLISTMTLSVSPYTTWQCFGCVDSMYRTHCSSARVPAVVMASATRRQGKAPMRFPSSPNPAPVKPYSAFIITFIAFCRASNISTRSWARLSSVRSLEISASLPSSSSARIRPSSARTSPSASSLPFSATAIAAATSRSSVGIVAAPSLPFFRAAAIAASASWICCCSAAACFFVFFISFFAATRNLNTASSILGSSPCRPRLVTVGPKSLCCTTIRTGSAGMSRRRKYSATPRSSQMAVAALPARVPSSSTCRRPTAVCSSVQASTAAARWSRSVAAAARRAAVSAACWRRASSCAWSHGTITVSGMFWMK